MCGAMMTHAHAGNSSDGFIQPPTRIKGCVAIMDKVRDGTISPTEWMEQNKEEFSDLQLELKERHYKPDKAKELMMGMAISICMERKGYENTCVTAQDQERRDLQIMKTAAIGECWEKPRPQQRTDNNNGNGGGGNSTKPPIIDPPPPPPPPPIVTNPWGVLNASLPPMSREDRNQYDEDVSIASRPVRPIGGQDYARFRECASYWQSLHYNRPPQVRQILYSVRVARCMFAHARGASYAVLLGPRGCPVTFASMLQPGCYARF
jgi:hypothetical protein